jgi:hypothetical protein
MRTRVVPASELSPKSLRASDYVGGKVRLKVKKTEHASSRSRRGSMPGLLKHDAVAETALRQMRERGGKWAAYENVALDSNNLGHLQYLMYGEGCTYGKPPERYPADTEYGTGWRYVFVGLVDLGAGVIQAKEGLLAEKEC